MNSVVWIKLMNEAIPLSLLIILGILLYRGLKKNQIFLSEREDLMKRYILFKGDKQVRLKVYGEDEKVYQEILRTLSTSWKNFKRSDDQCLLSFSQNTARTKLLLQLVTLGLLINSARVLCEEYYFYDLQARFLYAVARELSSYVLVLLSFFLLRAQTHPFLSVKGNAAKMDRETLFFSNNPLAERETEDLYNEFDPLEGTGAENGKEDQDRHR